MKTADVYRFLVACALVPDLYCPGYDPRQALAKDSNLARTAARYKVDMAKTIAAVTVELTKPKNEPTHGRKPDKKVATTSHRPKASTRKHSHKNHNIA